MAAEIEIGFVTEGDADVVSDFIFRLIDELAAGAGPDRETVVVATRQVLAMQSVTGMIASQGGKPLGVIMLNECAAIYAGGVFGEITELYVDSAQRSKGVAARLLGAAQDHAMRCGWKRLEVGAPAQPAWERSLKFYQREGFEEVGPRLRKKL